LVYTNPRYQSDLVIESYQAVHDPTYEVERDGRLVTFRRNLRPLEKMVVKGERLPRLLDIGAHIGTLVEVAKELGWDAMGVEPSRWAAERGRERGLNILNTTLREAKFETGTFDAVTIWDVIEHLSDPLGELSEIQRVLKPGGVLAVHTIDIDSLMSHVMGTRWPWLMEMHQYYFSPRTLGAMVKQAGLTTEQVRYQGRFLRLQYLVTRVAPYSKSIARLMDWFITHARIREVAVPINFYDLFTLFARKT
jgi:2-polyprenyl-3-methyl-5-hydroxy-6-metoxy-1,4-benzoquinol methylase